MTDNARDERDLANHDDTARGAPEPQGAGDEAEPKALSDSERIEQMRREAGSQPGGGIGEG